MKRLKNYIQLLKNEQAVGLDIIIQADGTYRMQVCKLKKIKNKIIIDSCEHNITDITQVKKITGSNLPVYLSISGKGILHKKTEYIPEVDESYYFSTILPGDTSNKDFYIQLSPPYGNYIFVSVVRKNVVDTVLKLLQENGIDILHCNLGPFVLHYIFPEIGNGQSFFEINLPYHHLKISNTQLLEYMPLKDAKGEGEHISLDGEKINSLSLIPFALGVQYFIKDTTLGIRDNILAQLKTIYQQKRIFNLSYPAALGLIAVSLIVFLTWKIQLEKKYNKLAFEISTYEPALKTYNDLSDTYTAKKDFLEKSGLGQASQSSYYIDRLLVNIPDAIQLDDLNYCPAKRKAANDSIILYNSKAITISGTSVHSALLNQWITELKGNAIVKEVSLENYKQDKSSNKAEFLLSISIK